MRAYPGEVRARVIQLLAAGWSPRHVAIEVGISARTVSRCRVRARQGQLAPLPLPGRARQIPPAVAEQLCQYIHAHPHTTLRELADWLATVHDIQVSHATVSRTMQRLGFQRARRPRTQ